MRRCWTQSACGIVALRRTTAAARCRVSLALCSELGTLDVPFWYVRLESSQERARHLFIALPWEDCRTVVVSLTAKHWHRDAMQQRFGCKLTSCVSKVQRMLREGPHFYVKHATLMGDDATTVLQPATAAQLTATNDLLDANCAMVYMGSMLQATAGTEADDDAHDAGGE